MLDYYGSTVVQRRFALVIPMIVVAWLVTAPSVIATASLLASLALLTAFARIVQITYQECTACGEPRRGASRR